MMVSEKRYLLVIGMLWTIVQIVTYVNFSTLKSIDTIFYLGSADQILSGDALSGRSWFYVSYSGLLALIQWLGFDVSFVVIIQLFCSLVAAYAIYYTSKSINNNSISGLIAAVFYIVWIKVHQWNFMIYTDSLFCSMAIISFAMIYSAKNKLQWVLALLIVMVTIFIRPNGVGLGIATVVFLIKLFQQRLYFTRVQTYAVTVLGVVLLLFVFNTMLAPYVNSFINSYQHAEIIYPKVQLVMVPGSNLILPQEDWPPLIRLSMFVVYNPIYFGKLFVLKAVLFVANIKPYFSWLHNLTIILFLYPIYYFAWQGFAKLEARPVRAFILAFILIQTGIVALTSENWDGRFLLPLLPFIFLLASGPLIEKIRMLSHVSGSLSRSR